VSARVFSCLIQNPVPLLQHFNELIFIKMIPISPTAVLIDDNEMTKAALRWILRNYGCKVIGEADNAEDGFRLVDNLQPTVVFLDITMPGGDGFEVLGKIKQQVPESMVIMVSANHDADTVRKALLEGAVGFIIKPFNPGRIVTALDRAMFHRRAICD
jgi:two-component system chemotaxis response regulator CheY